MTVEITITDKEGFARTFTYLATSRTDAIEQFKANGGKPKRIQTVTVISENSK